MKAPSPPTVPQPLQAVAPAFAHRLGAIFTGLQAVIARAFLHHPTRPASVIRPLCARLARATQRIQRLALRLAAGKLPWTRGPDAAPRAAPGPRQPSTDPMQFPPLPRTRGWVLADLRHEAAVYRNQLETLLAEPGVSDLLATAPAALRILRPICRMLALTPPEPPRQPAPLPPAPAERAAAPAQPTPPSARPRRSAAAPSLLTHLLEKYGQPATSFRRSFKKPA